MSYLIIFNPKSKGGKNAHRKKDLELYFEEKKVDFEIKETKALEDAYIFSREANQKNIEFIIAVGGDGTINQTINGFYNEEGSRISKSKFGVIYTGTSPDFCKSYNIPIDFDKALRNIFDGEILEIEIGKIKHLSQEKTEKTSYFACCANIGLGADLAEKANGGIRKYLGDFLGTFISLLRILFVYRGININIDKVEELKKVYNLSIGITPLIASGIKVENARSKGNGKFYVLKVVNLKVNNVIKVIKSVYGGKYIKNSDEIEIFYKENLSIQSENKEVKVEFDGDPQGYLPCSIEMARNKLEIIVPKGKKDGK